MDEIAKKYFKIAGYFQKKAIEAREQAFDRELLLGARFQFQLTFAASQGLLFECLLTAFVDPETFEVTPEGKVLLDQHYRKRTEELLPDYLK